MEEVEEQILHCKGIGIRIIKFFIALCTKH
jgi:hypothetical protein